MHYYHNVRLKTEAPKQREATGDDDFEAAEVFKQETGYVDESVVPE
jgi:hypothetical protein